MSSVPLQEIYQELIACHGNQFTGKFKVFSSLGQEWNLHFFLGKAVGDSGGRHPLRRWLRQTKKYCSNPTLDIWEAYNREEVKQGNYEPNKDLLINGFISREEALNLTGGSIIEIFWEIFAEGKKSEKNPERKISYALIPQSVNITDVPLAWVRLEPLWQEAVVNWQDWCARELVSYSPNLVPQIIDRAKLQRLVSPAAYEKLTQLIDGRQTLRDLAITVKQEVSTLTASLLIYCQEGLMQFVETEDLKINRESPSPSLAENVKVEAQTIEPQSLVVDRAAKKLLIAHIDDSPLDIKIMGQIIQEAGHDYINVQNPMLAMSTLLKDIPDLIFLDLVMPVANGYEICAQLRRISVFQETPIIILTSSDGIVDRVRAKMVNSTAFINKPIEQDKVLATLFRYLPELAVSS